MNVKQRLAVMAAATALVAAAVLGLWLSGIHERAADVEPSPFSGNEVESESPDGFPTVDWGYWLSVNPDIVAWVSVAGTEIDYPVVQARSGDPTFYLDHDVYREWNPYGCPYLDAACAGRGIDSPLALMFAHHMNDGSMFSAFASYSDAGFAAEHDEIATDEELSSWLDELLGRADVALVDGARTDSVKAFCTCSYGRWNGHERTIVYAQEEAG